MASSTIHGMLDAASYTWLTLQRCIDSAEAVVLWFDVPSRTGVDLCNSKKKTADDLAKEALAPQFLLLGHTVLEVSVSWESSMPQPFLAGMIVDALCSHPMCIKLIKQHPWHFWTCLNNTARYIQFWTCCWCNDAFDDLIFPKFSCTDASLVSQVQL